MISQVNRCYVQDFINHLDARLGRAVPIDQEIKLIHKKHFLIISDSSSLSGYQVVIVLLGKSVIILDNFMGV
jgi:hypothetical protein